MALVALMSAALACVAPPADLSFELVGSVRRSAIAFTEGFLFDDGKIIESVGRYKDQPVVINAIDPKTGRVTVLRPAPSWNGRSIFGEGLARLGSRFYQLTYDSGVTFVYHADSWELLYTVPMPQELFEGWGLTVHDGMLVMSNGAEFLYYLDSSNPWALVPVGATRVRDSSGRVYRGLNMLQSVGSSVYANIFPTDRIVRIDPDSGCVTGILDMNRLWLEFSDEELSQIRADIRANVLNGIAYDPDSGLFFITGKNWPRIFKIRIRD